MKLIFEHPAIEQVAIPVISSGNYNFDFEYAFKIGLTTVYNELLDKKSGYIYQRGNHYFDKYGVIEKQLFVVRTSE